MARPELKQYADSTCLVKVGFSGVGSADASKEKGTLKIKCGNTWIDIETHFVSSIPKGMNVISGLDNHFSAVDLVKREASLGRNSFVFQIHDEVETLQEKDARGDADLLVLFMRFNKVFAGNKKYYTFSKLPPLKIELLPEARAVRVQPHKMALEEEQMIEDEIAEMAALDFRRLNPQLRVVDYPTLTVEHRVDSIPLGFQHISSL